MLKFFRVFENIIKKIRINIVLQKAFILLIKNVNHKNSVSRKGRDRFFEKVLKILKF